MNAEKITEIVNKIPFNLLLLGFLANLGYEYYIFINDSTSVLGNKKAELAAMKTSNGRLRVKVTELENFVKTLELKKAELRRMVGEFQAASGTLADKLDTPLFMKRVITEAKKAGLKVETLQPKGTVEKEFYSETTFAFSYHGLFSQLLVFLQRMASTTEIIRVDEISLKPLGSSKSRFVEIKGDLEIRTYAYLSGKVDSMVKQMSANSEITPGSAASGVPGAGKSSSATSSSGPRTPAATSPTVPKTGVKP